MVARLLAIFKIQNVVGDATTVQRLALVRILNPINNGRDHYASGHICVGERINGRDMRIVSIGAVIGQVHIIPSGERQ